MVKTNQFPDIPTLVAAMASCPKDKEVGFKVSTWIMILTEMMSLRNILEKTNTRLEETNSTLSTVKNDITQEIKSDINTSDAESLLF